MDILKLEDILLKTIEFFTIGISVRLSDRSLFREEQKKIVKNCPQWGLKPGPPDHETNALPTELSQHSVQQVKWCMTQTKLTSEISCPTDSCLAQLVMHWPEDLSWFQTPLWAIFDKSFFALRCIKICQIIWQKCLSWKTQILLHLYNSDCYFSVREGGLDRDDVVWLLLKEFKGLL